MQADTTLGPQDDVLTELAKLGETRTWESGTTVVAEGDEADCMYLIHSGVLRALVTGSGGRTTELNTLGPGEFFGELMISGDRRVASVVVIERARLTRVAREFFERALVDQPRLALLLVQRLVLRVRTLTHTVGHLASVDVYGRLLGLFDALAVQRGDQRVVPGPISQARIAERLGASRSMVHRLLHDLVRGGYIEMTRERIVLLEKLPPRW